MRWWTERRYKPRDGRSEGASDRVSEGDPTTTIYISGDTIFGEIGSNTNVEQDAIAILKIRVLARSGGIWARLCGLKRVRNWCVLKRFLVQIGPLSWF